MKAQTIEPLSSIILRFAALLRLLSLNPFFLVLIVFLQGFLFTLAPSSFILHPSSFA